MRIVVALILVLGALKCSAEDSGYRLKVITASEAEKMITARFVILPEDLRIICTGDPTGISVGDYIKVELLTDKIVAGKLTCSEIRWYRDGKN